MQDITEQLGRILLLPTHRALTHIPIPAQPSASRLLYYSQDKPLFREHDLSAGWRTTGATSPSTSTDDRFIDGLLHNTCAAIALTCIQVLAADFTEADPLELSPCQRSTSTIRCIRTMRTDHHHPCLHIPNSRLNSRLHSRNMSLTPSTFRIPLWTIRDIHLRVDRQQDEGEAEVEVLQKA